MSLKRFEDEDGHLCLDEDFREYVREVTPPDTSLERSAVDNRPPSNLHQLHAYEAPEGEKEGPCRVCGQHRNEIVHDA